MQSRRFIASAVVAVAAFGPASTALAHHGLTGTYATTVTSPAKLKGKWVLVFAKDARYRVELNGEPLAHGRYRVTARTIKFRESASAGCGGKGTYGWMKSGKSLRFMRIRESARCPERKRVLAHRFTQIH